MRRYSIDTNTACGGEFSCPAGSVNEDKDGLWVEYGEALALKARAEKAEADLGALNAYKHMFPIQGGSAVPWAVMAPHDAQCRKNHGGQSLEDVAKRGGLSPSEAWCVVQSVSPYILMRTMSWVEMADCWRAFAEDQNRRYRQMAAIDLSSWRVNIHPTAESCMEAMWGVPLSEIKSVHLEDLVGDDAGELSVDELLATRKADGVDGFCDTPNKVVHLWFAPDADRNAVLELLAHEFSHALFGTEETQAVADGEKVAQGYLHQCENCGLGHDKDFAHPDDTVSLCENCARALSEGAK